jgi:hypothetical protein
MPINHFEQQLTGGHPNSLGNTERVVAEVLQDRAKFSDLYDCYQSPDAVVRLRVSSAMKRICKVKPGWILEYIDKFQTEIANLDQPSAKWSLAQIFMWLDDRLSAQQRERAIEIMKHNLMTDKDWIVQNITADSLAHFAGSNPALKTWLVPQLHEMMHSRHNSVVRKAQKLLNAVEN